MQQWTSTTSAGGEEDHGAGAAAGGREEQEGQEETAAGEEKKKRRRKQRRRRTKQGNKKTKGKSTFVRSAGKEGGLVDEVGQVGPSEACGAGSNAVHRHILPQRQALLLDVSLQNLLPSCTHTHMYSSWLIAMLDWALVCTLHSDCTSRMGSKPPFFLPSPPGGNGVTGEIQVGFMQQLSSNDCKNKDSIRVNVLQLTHALEQVLVDPGLCI